MFFLVFLFIAVSSTQCANILGVFMFPSMNHQIIFQQIWKELSLRGHQVTVVTPDPLEDPGLTNLTEISVRCAYDVLKEFEAKDPFFETIDSCADMANFYHLLNLIAEEEFNNAEFKKLLRSEKKFDLILIELMHPVMHVLAYRFNAPVIAIAATRTFSVYYDAVGNPNHPVLHPDPIFKSNSEMLSMRQKIQSLMFFLWNKFHYHFIFVNRAQEIAKRHFGQNIPYIGDLERNVSMIFVNRNLVLDLPRPNVPAVVEISPLKFKTAGPVPKEIENVINASRHGVIYLNFRGNLICEALKDKLHITLQALSELPYQFLWKWNCNFDLPRRLSNVIINESLSHNVLAHPNMKALVTQGELHELEEAITYEVPLISLYVKNPPPYAERIKYLGIGTTINLEGLTKVELKNVLVKVVEKQSYKDRITKASKILLDQPMTGLEKVIWWSEFVIRSKGAAHLRSPAIDMPLYEYLLLDVLLFLFSFILLAIYLSRKFYKFIMRQKKDPKVKQN